MNMMFNLVVVVQVISALSIIALVLLQHGKGADMGAAFGSGASGSLFGATGYNQVLSGDVGDGFVELHVEIDGRCRCDLLRRHPGPVADGQSARHHGGRRRDG